MTTKLTLTMEDKVIDSAKKYAHKKGKSLSDIVENYLRSITTYEKTAVKLSPKVTRMMGAIKLPEDFNYKKDIGNALAKKTGNMMKHVFIDTNVVIDFLANRPPFAMDAARLFNLTIDRKVRIYVSAVSYNNIYYILRQSLTNNATIKLLDELAEMTEITDVTSAIIRQSLKTDFKDYEDAIQYYCALSIPKINFIVTCNTKDFKKSTLPALTPTEAIVSLVNDL